MALGNDVIVTADPGGLFKEGYISGTPKPGTILQIKASVAKVNGRFTYEAYAPGTGDGTPRPTIVLLPDHLQGKTVDDAYVSGDRCFMYCPRQGEELNIRKANLSGTGSATEDLNIGERLLVVDGTGMISPVAVGVANSLAVYNFTALEAVTDQEEEQLVHCMYSAN